MVHDQREDVLVVADAEDAHRDGHLGGHVEGRRHEGDDLGFEFGLRNLAHDEFGQRTVEREHHLVRALR